MSNNHPSQKQELKVDPVIEQRILGAILFNNELYHNISGKVKEELFYFERNQIIWDIIKTTIDDGEKIDLLHLFELVRRKDLTAIIPADYVAKIGNSDSIDINRDIKLLTRDYFTREYATYNDEANQKIITGEHPYTVTKWHQEKLDNLFILNEDEGKSFSELILDTNLDIKNKKEGINNDRLFTGTELDNIFDLTPDETIWLSSRAKSGKTKILIYVISKLLEKNPETGIRWWSFEDPVKRIISNIYSVRTGMSIKRLEGQKEKLTDEEYNKIVTTSKLMKDYDISLSYGVANVEKVTTESISFVRKRKKKTNIVIIDNFNSLVASVKYGSQNEKENAVVDALWSLRVKLNEDNMKTIIIVLDHLSKSVFKGGLESGYRAGEDALRGSGRKLDALTTLLFINKLSRNQDLVDQYTHIPNKILGDGKEWSMESIMRQMTILEVITSRNERCESGVPIRFLTNLETMQFQPWEKMKNPPENSLEETELSTTEQQSFLNDTGDEEEQDEEYEPF